VNAILYPGVLKRSLVVTAIYRVLFAVVSTGLCLAGAVLIEPVSAKETPLYVGDFGPRLVSSNGEFVLPNHSRVQWTVRSVRSLGNDSSPSQPIDCGARSYRSYEQRENTMHVRNLSRGYIPGETLPSSNFNGTKVQLGPVADFRAKRCGSVRVARPIASYMPQSATQLYTPSATVTGHVGTGQHRLMDSKSSPNADRFHFPVNYYKIEAAPSNSH
jgi:hypothetical protein